jgi:hypothetical protein
VEGLEKYLPFPEHQSTKEGNERKKLSVEQVEMEKR